MLTNLYIENIAVIEKSRIDFTGGLNVLTGETGAGKSIVIDSINAVLGHRSSRGMIRSGADAAFVSATFEGLSELTLKKLRAMGYEAEDDTLILSRDTAETTLASAKAALNAANAAVAQAKASAAIADFNLRHTKIYSPISGRSSRLTARSTASSKPLRLSWTPPIPTRQSACAASTCSPSRYRSSMKPI